MLVLNSGTQPVQRGLALPPNPGGSVFLNRALSVHAGLPHMHDSIGLKSGYRFSVKSDA